MAEPLITEQVAEILGPVETYVRTGQEWIVLGVGVGLTVGFGAGYLFAKRRLETKYDKLAQEEIDEAREYYRAAKSATEARLKEPIEEVVEYLGYIKKEAVQAEEVKQTVEEIKAEVLRERHPMNTSDWVWDQAKEEALREANAGDPYVICLDEWGERNHEGYEQSCF